MKLLRVLALASTATASCGCLGSMCANTLVQRVQSPDGGLEAVLFERSCGATTDFSTQVSVIRAGEELANKGGNVLVAGCDDDQDRRASWGGPPAEMAWRDRDHLVVRHPRDVWFERKDRVDVSMAWFQHRAVQIVYLP